MSSNFEQIYLAFQAGLMKKHLDSLHVIEIQKRLWRFMENYRCNSEQEWNQLNDLDKQFEAKIIAI